MLLGEYEHTIDDKNRLTLPARFRKELAEGLVVTRGLDSCLYAFPRAGWEESIRGRLSRLDPLDRDVVVAGVDDHLEIWDRAAWRAHLTEIEGSAEHVAERLASGRD